MLSSRSRADGDITARRAKCRALAVIPVAALLASCVREAPPPRPAVVPVTTVAASPAEVETATRAVLADLGLADIRADQGTISGLKRDLGEDPSVQCPEPRVRDTDGERIRRADPEQIDLSLTVDLEPVAAGTAVTVAPVFTRTYTNDFTFTTFERRCRSAGDFERKVIARLESALSAGPSQS